MADVFISYAKTARAVTERLATILAGEGYSVWWDAALVSGDSYRSVILKELDAARAVIVVWTQASVESAWVISEAERAADAGKLITLRTRDVSVQRIPMPFGVRHTDLVDNSAAVLAALGSMGVRPSGAKGTAAAQGAAAARSSSGVAHGAQGTPVSWGDLGQATVWIGAVAVALVGVIVLINSFSGGESNEAVRRFSGSKVFTGSSPGVGGGGGDWSVEAEERAGRLPQMDAPPATPSSGGPTN